MVCYDLVTTGYILGQVKLIICNSLMKYRGANKKAANTKIKPASVMFKKRNVTLDQMKMYIKGSNGYPRISKAKMQDMLTKYQGSPVNAIMLKKCVEY